MKLLIAALLAVFSTNVMAEWTRVGENAISVQYAYLSTIRKSGDKVKMWDLVDYKVVRIDKNDGMRNLSTKSQKEFDCKEETWKFLVFNQYSQNMGAGEMVYMSRNQHEEPMPISPGSTLEILFKVACGK